MCSYIYLPNEKNHAARRTLEVFQFWMRLLQGKIKQIKQSVSLLEGSENINNKKLLQALKASGLLECLKYVDECGHNPAFIRIQWFKLSMNLWEEDQGENAQERLVYAEARLGEQELDFRGGGLLDKPTVSVTNSAGPVKEDALIA